MRPPLYMRILARTIEATLIGLIIVVPAVAVALAADYALGGLPPLAQLSIGAFVGGLMFGVGITGGRATKRAIATLRRQRDRP